MAITIDSGSARIISYAEFAEFLTDNIDMCDDDSVLEAAESLSALGNDKDLALTILNEEVIGATMQQPSSFVSHHSMIIGRGKPKRGGVGFAVRMNFWPTLPETSLLSHHRKNVEHTYSYGYPHDHNFTLLTVGYAGPGYETEIYERDLGQTLHVGEHAHLKFLERTRLRQGRVIFFRKSEDIHIQIPPERISISLNLLPEQQSDANTEQYYFDVEKNITRDYILGSGITGRVTLIKAIAGMGLAEAAPLLVEILTSTDVVRVKHAALQALRKLVPHDTEYFDRIASRDDGLSPMQAYSTSF